MRETFMEDQLFSTPPTLVRYLYWIIVSDDLKQVSLLLKSGFDLNVSDRYRRNLIHYIALNGDAQMLQIVTEYLKYISGLQD